MVLNTGSSLHQYLLNYRISMAIELIESTYGSITDIAYQVGFKDISHFSKYFKKKTGRAPSEFRRMR
jgi:AraC-like DNA-binding protein